MQMGGSLREGTLRGLGTVLDEHVRTVGGGAVGRPLKVGPGRFRGMGSGALFPRALPPGCMAPDVARCRPCQGFRVPDMESDLEWKFHQPTH